LKEIYGDFPHYLSLENLEHGKDVVRELLGNEEKLFSRIDEAQNYVSGFASIKNYSDRLADLILGFMGNKIEVSSETKVRVYYSGDVQNIKSQSYKSINLSKVEKMSDIGLNIPEDYVFLCRNNLTLNSKAIENMFLIAKNSDADIVYGNYDVKDRQMMIPDFNLDLSLIKPGMIYGLLLFKRSILEKVKSTEIPDNWELYFVEKFKDAKWVNCRLTLFRTDENIYENQDLGVQVNEIYNRNNGNENFFLEKISKNNFQIRCRLIERPKTLVIIPAGSFEFLPKLYSSLEENGLSNLELVVCHHVIGGNYSQELLDFCKERSIRVIKTNGQFNFCKINNFAFDIACKDHKYIILLNDDIILQKGSIDMILSSFKYRYDKVGIVGAKLIYESPEFPENWTVPKCEIQHAGVILIRDYGCTHINRKALSNKISVNVPKIMDCVTFAFVAIDVECYESVRMDEDLPVEFNDMDFCLRAKTKGWNTLFFPPVLAMHLETATRKKLSLIGIEKDSKLFSLRYKDLFKNSMNYYEMRGLERLGL
jgi:GT2 family glycosyltransferase